MKCNTLAILLPAAAFLVACGEPLTKTEVVQKYSEHTVSKLTSENQYKHMGPNDPSLGQRYIFHSSNGSAYYFKATDKGYKRREVGRWWAGEDKICYSMRTTRSEDPEGDQCAPAGTDVVWSSFERGDTKGLVPKRSTARRSSGTDIGFGYDKVLTGLAVAVAGAAVVATVADGVCGSSGCSDTDTAPVPARNASNGQCKATKQQCYASCEGQSNEGHSVLTGDIGSPKRACKAQCSKISC